MLYVLEIAMTLLGVATLVKGQIEFVGGKIVRRLPAYVVGALLTLTCPLVLLAGFVFALIADNSQLDLQSPYWPIAVEIAAISVIAVASFVITATAAKEPVLQFSLQTLMIVMALVAIVLGVYRGLGWKCLAYYYLLVFAVGPWFAHLVSECMPVRQLAMRVAAGHLLLLLLFIGALKISVLLMDGQVVLLVGLAALLLWTPQYMVFFVWRGSFEN
jgi:hypothetical protein